MLIMRRYMADARAIMMSKYKETVETRHRMATVTFQLDVYKRLSQKLRQEVKTVKASLLDNEYYIILYHTCLLHRAIGKAHGTTYHISERV